MTLTAPGKHSLTGSQPLLSSTATPQTPGLGQPAATSCCVEGPTANPPSLPGAQGDHTCGATQLPGPSLLFQTVCLNHTARLHPPAPSEDKRGQGAPQCLLPSVPCHAQPHLSPSCPRRGCPPTKPTRALGSGSRSLGLRQGLFHPPTPATALALVSPPTDTQQASQGAGLRGATHAAGELSRRVLQEGAPCTTVTIAFKSHANL